MEKELEKVVLAKLEKGLLDGVVGDFFETGVHAKVAYLKTIKNGIPQIVRFGAGSRFFDNKETVRVAGKKSVQLFKTVAEKLLFLQRFGWLMSDPDVRAYSALFKPKKSHG